MLVREIAHTILKGFDKHYRIFREAGAAAKAHFEQRNWKALRDLNVSRTQLYDQRVREAVEVLAREFPNASRDESLWPQIKLAYIGLLYDHRQPECAETFYNSVACRVLDRRYYHNAYIFWRPAVSTEYLEGDKPAYRCYYPRKDDGDLKEIFERVLLDFELRNPWENLPRDLDFMMRVIRERYPDQGRRKPNFQVQVISFLFFRNKGAYVVGRVQNGRSVYPFVIPLLQNERGELFVDTLLLDRRNIGRVFSLVRSYFLVDMEVPSTVVSFLQSLLPNYPQAELYTMLGLQKQGKTLLYRDLQHHLRHSSDTFVIAPGTRGMVMVVFTLPSLPYVFKVIRDRFEPPKNTDPAHVIDRYLLVKHHDRVGRMADTLEYSHVAFPKSRFAPELIAELNALAPSSTREEGDQLVIRHLYIERRLVPLDLYVREADEQQLRDVMKDYGSAIKDLIGANIFPGDLLLKNFGVTRFGRVVFYDYDEICYLTECNFRHLPQPRSDEEEFSGEPWFQIEKNDVFPEQFPTFLVPEGRLREMFMEHHRDLADPGYWTERQRRLQAGILDDVFPYPERIRFQHRFQTAAA